LSTFCQHRRKSPLILISQKPFWFNNVKPSIAEPAELSTPTVAACLSLRPLLLLLCYGSVKQPSNNSSKFQTFDIVALSKAVRLSLVSAIHFSSLPCMEMVRTQLAQLFYTVRGIKGRVKMLLKQSGSLLIHACPPVPFRSARCWADWFLKAQALIQAACILQYQVAWHCHAEHIRLPPCFCSCTAAARSSGCHARL